MRVWETAPEERTELYSPIGLRPMDEMTGLAPIGKVSVHLEFRDGAGDWRKTEIKAIVTPGGVIAYPGLERRPHVAGEAPRRYRALLEADLYRPLYRATKHAIEFDAHPFNNDNPPHVITSVPEDVFMMPACNYPFPGYIPVLHGLVVDTSGGGVVDALVSDGVRERVLTDERGAFALPLRWVKKNMAIVVNASDLRTGRTGTIHVAVPTDMGRSHTITIS